MLNHKVGEVAELKTLYFSIMPEIIKTNCESCDKEISIEEAYPCEKCEKIISHCCQAGYNQFSQIDYNCCQDCAESAKFRNEDDY